MIDREPTTDLDPRFSSEGATPATWAEGRERLEAAEVYWISTVRPNTTGCNRLGEGLDLVIEGDATRLTDEAALRRVADAYLSKYGEDWRFAVRDGAFYHDPGSLREADPGAAWVYEVLPRKIFGFGKGATFAQTRWRF